MKNIFFIAVVVISLLTLPTAPVKAGFFDKVMKEVLKGNKKEAAPAKGAPPAKKQSKEQMIFSGLKDILASSGEMSFKKERTMGESLALEAFGRYGMPVKNEKLQNYVNLVGVALAQNSTRPSIPYNFVVVKSDLYNAFACPGGIIFVTSALLSVLENEAQLAAVLAHEISHVAAKHALKSIKRTQFLSGAAKLTAASMKGKDGQKFQAAIGDLQTVLFDKGLDKNMEYEADAMGLETAYRTGYDPLAMREVLEALLKREKGAKKSGSWFGTHPPLNERIKKISKHLKTRYPDGSELAHLGKRFKANTN
jgi:predicted Zn-dependent protease